MRVPLTLCALLICASFTPAADALTPDEAVKRFKLPDGFSIRAVAAEPMIRQPLSMSFDARGRLWVLQNLQYPHYAGLKAVKQDQYLRTVYDKVPEPPPHGPRGADRITICYDPDENGVFRKSKDFVTGLNIASGFCIGNGGVYVAQPPYLLFYPDKNEDDVPDGDPEVLLSGFGMEDSHSLANSLQWGPDGWLYGAAGSTSTCKITNPANPKEVVEFQQGVWRYHAKTKRFELFSEGGGNTYGLDFDTNGQAITGTNWGGFACLHQMQGAYYVKGFSKHGPLHNPYAYGHLEHVPYTGFKGGHVTCGGVLYDADAYPEPYRGQYIAGNLLSNAVYWHKLEPFQSSYKASHGGDLVTTDDTWFRPVDLTLGPDGCVYVADWYDKRAAHLDPVDSWHKSSGRVYRIEYRGGPKYETFDLRKKTTAELADLLKHPNKWWRNEARRLIAERGDASVHPKLRKWLFTETGHLALEALWALGSSGGWTEEDFGIVGTHENAVVRAWMIRLIGDEGRVSEPILQAFSRIAASEKNPVVVAQVACSARRFTPEQEHDLATSLMNNAVVSADPQLPLLVWWALEDCNRRDTTDTVRFPYPGPPNRRLADFFNERVARRFMSGNVTRGTQRIGTLFQMIPGANDDIRPALRGVATALQAYPQDSVPPALRAPLANMLKQNPRDLLVLEVLARMKDEPARATLRAIVADEMASEGARLQAVNLLRQVRDPRSEELFLEQFALAKTDDFRSGLLGGLETFDDAQIGTKVLAGYNGYSPAVKKRSVQLLLTRPVWALPLLKQWEAGQFPKADLTVDHARAAIALGDKTITAIVEKHFGKLAAATAGEKQARIGGLNIALGKEKGDAARGKALFTKHCAACHQLHGEGGKVGPDLTTADRKNRMYLLANVVDPSGYIRPEYVTYSVLTKDDRKLSGIATDSAGESVTLVNVTNDQVVRTTIAKADIAEMLPSPVSLMPEKLLDALTEPQVADLFAYLASDGKKPTPPAPPAGSPSNSLLLGKGERKLRVGLLSGSFEYKSDDSLAAFQKHLEEHYPVECVRMFAKAEKDVSLPGSEALETCDVVVFFTRRLEIEGESLERVKKYVSSGKPVVGVRTASHGFQKWLAMDKDVLGGDYKGHFGAGVAEVTVTAAGKAHPILKGVMPFKANGSLYKNPNVAADVTVLMQGYMGKESEPVAWTREKDGRRVFYTSLGYPDDFKNDNFVRLLTNGLAWATKSEWEPK
ncbi:PVC-type heme-binding CxxCH protein [Frigoriglobus tundricola]|uniref:Beta-propeller-type glycoside hydrolase n=1 Tax=Frigoriglobus tundricola TaxID=2774151 RepID=A0A6M5YIW8_9BACT|nr:PVC-type heme-binding CxxCH protein [Frigoriglobus tundricola]QJW93494.1 beta-propeller-type glycoside hydrolase [Frigoriglobus tundricola]